MWLYSITKMISITVLYYVKLSYLVPFIHDENPTGVIFHAVILLWLILYAELSLMGGGTFSDLFASIYSAVSFYDLFTPSYITWPLCWRIALFTSVHIETSARYIHWGALGVILSVWSDGYFDRWLTSGRKSIYVNECLVNMTTLCFTVCHTLV